MAIDDSRIGTVLYGQIDFFLSRASRDYLGPHGFTQFDRREANPASRTQHKQGLARLDLTPVLQRVIAGAVGQDESCGVIKGHGVWDLSQTSGRANHFFGQPAIANLRQNPVADLYLGDTFAQGFYDPRDFTTWRKGPQRLGLILVFDH